MPVNHTNNFHQRIVDITDHEAQNIHDPSDLKRSYSDVWLGIYQQVSEEFSTVLNTQDDVPGKPLKKIYAQIHHREVV